MRTFHSQIMNHELAQRDLVSALMKFYTDIETTGQSTEFYDKFTIRYELYTTVVSFDHLLTRFISKLQISHQSFVQEHVGESHSAPSDDRRVKEWLAIR